MGLGPLEIFKLFQCVDRLFTSESDVNRRQILTSKVDPSTGRGKSKVEIQLNGNISVYTQNNDTTFQKCIQPMSICITQN